MLVSSQNAGPLEILGTVPGPEMIQEAAVSQSSHNVPRKFKEHRFLPPMEILVPSFKELVKKRKENANRLPAGPLVMRGLGQRFPRS